MLRRYYGDATLNQLPLDVMIPATRVSDGRAFYFVRDNPANSQNTGALTLVDCVTASAAAPTYFQPWNVPGFGECVDGGVGIAGNPAYQACVEALDYTLPETYRPEATTVISLGTGYFNPVNAPGNIVAWATWILGELLRDPAEQQTQIIQRHYVPLGLIQHRLNPALPKDIGLDDVNAIPELIAIGATEAAKLDWRTLLSDSNSAPLAPLAPASIPRNVM
jgi:patatin-like phospholipase/acyl hydrolase